MKDNFYSFVDKKRYRSRSSIFVCEFNCRFLPLFSLSYTRLSRAPPDRPSVRRCFKSQDKGLRSERDARETTF